MTAFTAEPGQVFLLNVGWSGLSRSFPTSHSCSLWLLSLQTSQCPGQCGESSCPPSCPDASLCQYHLCLDPSKPVCVQTENTSWPTSGLEPRASVSLQFPQEKIFPNSNDCCHSRQKVNNLFLISVTKIVGFLKLGSRSQICLFEN